MSSLVKSIKKVVNFFVDTSKALVGLGPKPQQQALPAPPAPVQTLTNTDIKGPAIVRNTERQVAAFGGSLGTSAAGLLDQPETRKKKLLGG